jgi:hypothetical protein
MRNVLIAAAALAICASTALARPDSLLQVEMQRIVALEHVDAWCAGGDHAIDYDRLRARIDAEKDKALATGASEQEARVAYQYAETVFRLQNPSPEMFCEIVFRARAHDPGWRQIFPNQLR